MLSNYSRQKVFKGDELVACVIVYTDFRFYPMACVARSSFQYHHPDVSTFLVGPDQLPFFQRSLIGYVSGEFWGIGATKYSVAGQIKAMGYRKVICLGADTITFARLDEFMDDDIADVLTSSDANNPLFQKLHFETHSMNGDNLVCGSANIAGVVSRKDMMDEYMHINADVICFNDDIESYMAEENQTDSSELRLVRQPSSAHPDKCFLSMFFTIFSVTTRMYSHLSLSYKEQGLLNLMLTPGDHGKKIRETFISRDQFHMYEPDFGAEHRNIIYDKWIEGSWRVSHVDLPYFSTDVLYNIRSIYENDSDISREELNKRVSKFYTKDNKIYNRDDKQIKILHLRDSITHVPLTELGEHINSWANAFPGGVKELLRSTGCKNFFDTDWISWYKKKMRDLTQDNLPRFKDNFDFLDTEYKNKTEEHNQKTNRSTENDNESKD